MPKEILPPNVALRDFEDFDSERREIFSGAKAAMTQAFPLSYGGFRLHVEDVDYEDPDHRGKAEQKKALLHDTRLVRRLRGTVVLSDEKSGQELERKRMTLMRVPHLTERGTFIRDGNEYVHVKQLRLLPGPYTRRKQNGELETQFNVRPGSGTNFRVLFRPEDSQYRLSVQQSELHLYSLLKDLGVGDEELKKRWGDAVFAANSQRYDSRVVDKAYERLVPRWARKPEAARDDKIAAVKDALGQSQVHERVAKRHLPGFYGGTMKQARVIPQALPPLVSSHSAKVANVEADSLRMVAVFLNEQHQAGIDLDLPKEALEDAIIAFLQKDPSVDEKAFLAAAGKPTQEPPKTELAPTTLELPKEAKQKAAEPGDRGCLMLRLPLQAAADIVEWTDRNVPREQRVEDERDPHITVAWGFDQSVTPEDIRDALDAWGGDRIAARIGDISFFEGASKDVLKLSVESRDLRELYRFLRKFFGDKLISTFPNYTPHLTLAYIKPGALRELVGTCALTGSVVVGRSVLFSDCHRKHKTLALGDFQ